MEQNEHHHEEITVALDHFSYGWGKRASRANLHMAGRFQRTGLNCTFRLEVTRRGHHLSFPTATTRDEGEDLRSLALSVKNALLKFLRETPEVPEAHRQTLCDCVLNHHLQQRPIK